MGTAVAQSQGYSPSPPPSSLVAACGDDEPEVQLVEGVTVEVDALDNTFRPEDVEVQAGTEVLWTNVGRNEHDVAPAEGDDFGVEAEGFSRATSTRSGSWSPASTPTTAPCTAPPTPG